MNSVCVFGWQQWKCERNEHMPEMEWNTTWSVVRRMWGACATQNKMWKMHWTIVGCKCFQQMYFCFFILIEFYLLSAAWFSFCSVVVVVVAVEVFSSPMWGWLNGSIAKNTKNISLENRGAPLMTISELCCHIWTYVNAIWLWLQRNFRLFFFCDKEFPTFRKPNYPSLRIYGSHESIAYSPISP